MLTICRLLCSKSKWFTRQWATESVQNRSSTRNNFKTFYNSQKLSIEQICVRPLFCWECFHTTAIHFLNSSLIAKGEALNDLIWLQRWENDKLSELQLRLQTWVYSSKEKNVQNEGMYGSPKFLVCFSRSWARWTSEKLKPQRNVGKQAVETKKNRKNGSLTNINQKCHCVGHGRR